jgi:3-dehydroquinate synthase
MTTVTRLPVAGASPYDVIVGNLDESALAEHLQPMLGEALGHQVARVGLLHDAAPELRPAVDRVRRAASQLGVPVIDLPLVGGEHGKTAVAAVAAWEALGAAGFTRSDAVITVGGGATTDLGGFVAATWLRGVRVVHVPTTLLAMVDAAVGGKTGINTDAGKNLVGSFHEPSGVICDLGTLRTLPRPEFVSGLGEVIKCGFIADPAILDVVERSEPSALAWDAPAVQELVERSLRVKIDVVSVDLRETGGPAGPGGVGGGVGRELLNYGHTMAHAIERAENYAVRHGEAVALGCVFVAELAGVACGLAPEVVARHHTAFARVGLPTAYSGPGFATLRATMSVDKKARGSTLRFVVLEDLAKPRVLTGPDEADLMTAYHRMAGVPK